MKDITKYQGVIPAFYACYDAEGNISTEGVKALTRHLIAKGVKGVYVGGSSGECIYQHVDERKAVLEAVMSEAKGKLTVIAHVGCNNTADSVELARHAESVGVDAIASIPPIYFHLPEYAIAKYWNAMSAAAPNTEFVIYNIPQLAGTGLTMSLLKEMLKNPNVVAVKNSSMPTQDIQMFKDAGIATVAFGYKRVQKGRLNKKNQAVCDLEIDEEEAAIVRLIFQKYVYEGYGVKRICNYLVENHIMGRNGKNIPTTTLVRMVRNKCYTGYLINGNVEKECPELRIIEQEVFDRAQELRDTRRREKGEDSDSYSPHALLCGKVFCAHCGNRLNITSSGRTRLRADGSTVKEKRFRYSCHYNVRHPGQCDGQSGYGVTKLDAIVESIVCTKFSEILECSKSKLLQDMLRKDMEVAQKEVSRAKSELGLKDDERNALKDEMIRVIRGKSSIDRDMIQQLLDENQAAIQAAQDALTAAQNKLEEIEQENKKAENDCSNLFTWASIYQNASFQQRQTILNQFIKEVRVGRDYDIEIILNVPLEEFEEFKSHSLSVRTPSGRKTDLKQAPVRGLGTPNGGIVVFDKTSGEAMNIMPKSSAHVTLRCQDE